MIEKIQKVSESLDVSNVYGAVANADKKFNLFGWFAIVVVLIIFITVVLGVASGSY